MQATRLSAGESARLPSPEGPILSVVVPTFNEATNLPELFDRLLAFVRESNLSIETIVVDDASPDGTGVLAEELAVRHNGTLSARVLHRPGKLGLSSALFDGIRASRAPWIAMIDADNSHDVKSLRVMFAAAQDGADVVIGSRYIQGGKIEQWPLRRRLISLLATAIARALFRLEVRDPMSGFAILRRDIAMKLDGLRNPRAYKLLLEVLVRLRSLHIREVPITFRDRTRGSSKLSWKEIVEFDRLILALLHEHSSRSYSPSR